MRIVRCHAPDQDAQIAALLLLLRACACLDRDVVRPAHNYVEPERPSAQLREERSAGGIHVAP
jgi:hypothetical protein